MKNNLLDLPPQSLVESGIKIVYISPAQRANQAQEAEATMRAVERIIALSQVFPQILDNYDADKLARQIHSDFAAAPMILKNKREVDQLRRQRQEAQAQQAKSEEVQMLEEQFVKTPEGQAQAAEILNQMRGGV